MKIITGYTGEKQITSTNDASIFTGIIGKQNYVLNSMNNLAYQLMGNNVIRIKSGVVNYAGRYGIIEEYEDVEFENGKQGVTRTDVLVARYAMDELTGIESMKLVMITGTSSVPAKPLSTDFPLYQITLSGINVSSVVAQFDILLSMKELKELIEATEKSITSAYTNADKALESAIINRITAEVSRLGTEIDNVRTGYVEADKALSTDFKKDIQDTDTKISNLAKAMMDELAAFNQRLANIERELQ